MKSEEIATALRERIEAGRLPPEQRPADALPPGSAIPTVDALEAQHGLSRATAGRVHSLLRSAGLIHTKSGRSAVVADPSPLYVITTDAYARARQEGDLTAWERQVQETGDGAHTVHYTGHLTEAPDLGQDSRGETIGDLLHSDGDTFLHLAGDGHATPMGPTGTPDSKLERVVQIYDLWTHARFADVVPAMLEARDPSWRGGAFGVLERGAGVFPEPVRRIITERITTKAEEVRFRVPPMTPISAEVEVSMDAATGERLCVVLYRRLFGVAQWDLA